MHTFCDKGFKSRILRANIHAYIFKYSRVLEQLVDSYRMFEKPTEIMGIPDAALDKYEVRMNKWDNKLQDFMLSAEKNGEHSKMTTLSGAPLSRCG